MVTIGIIKLWPNKRVKQSLGVRKSPRFDTIILSRERIDYFIPFFTILDRRYRVVNITFTDGKNIKGVRKEDIEKDIPFMSAGNQIKEIYITVRK